MLLFAPKMKFMMRYWMKTLIVVLLGLTACSSPQTTPSQMPNPVSETTQNPVADLTAAASSGKALYVVNCSLCHGEDGRSPEDSLGAKPPDLTTGKIVSDSDGTIFLIIKNGVKKDGRPTMPPAKKLSDEEIWQLTAYVRTLAKK